MSSKQVIGVWVILIASLVTALIDLPITQSQTTCAAGSYTLNGDLKVTGTVEAANVKAGSSGFSSCEVVQAGAIANCPAGKFVTGASCSGASGNGYYFYNPQAGGYSQVPPPACQLAGYTKDGVVVTSGQANGARCSCGMLWIICC